MSLITSMNWLNWKGEGGGREGGRSRHCVMNWLNWREKETLRHELEEGVGGGGEQNMSDTVA